MKMTMRYAHLSPAFLSAEVGLLDPPKPDPADAKKGKKTKRARKGQSETSGKVATSRTPDFVRKFGSSGWTRTSNPPVNSRMLCH
jgi:hypothetical protein